MWQIIAHQHRLAVAGHSEVAGVDAGTCFGYHLQIVNIEFADPAVARGEIDEAAIRGELWPAMQRKARLETVNRLEFVAIQNGGMVFAQLHHDEEIKRVGAEYRFAGQTPGRHMLKM